MSIRQRQEGILDLYQWRRGDQHPEEELDLLQKGNMSAEDKTVIRNLQVGAKVDLAVKTVQ